jgi:hypothetical protein
MRLTTPGAILLGFVSIAIAVFFGLRTRAVTPTGSGADASTTAAPIPPSSDLPLPDPPKGAPASGAVADVVHALAAQHDALVKACWGPSMEGRVAYVVRVQFDDQGHQSTKAQLSARGQVRLDVSECVAGKLAPFAIARANAPARVEVPFTLP